jgi:hypothetical protein
LPRLGILGSLVWDTIHPPGGGSEPEAVVSDWGGIAYSLAAFDAARPVGWEALPIVKVGSDLRGAADEFLAGLPSVGSLDAVLTVPEPNNRVELFYGDRARRCERLTGGVPGWSWPELAGPALSCDALYVNLVAGWEVELETARVLRAAFPGSIYCDVHSLPLAVGEDGVRTLRPVPEWPGWRGCFDAVQMNEEELRTVAYASGDPDAEARRTVREGPATLFVTKGAAGAAWYHRTGGGVRFGTAPGIPVAVPDPTGCGDVWGTVCAASLLAGSEPADAASRANRYAARAAVHRGTDGLAAALVHDELPGDVA